MTANQTQHDKQGGNFKVKEPVPIKINRTNEKNTMYFANTVLSK